MINPIHLIIHLITPKKIRKLTKLLKEEWEILITIFFIKYYITVKIINPNLR